MTDHDALRKKILNTVREVGLLRKELLHGEREEGSIAVEFTHEELGTLVYALALAWITEYVNAKEGYVKLIDRIGEVSSVIMAADLREGLDKFLDDTLGGEAA